MKTIEDDLVHKTVSELFNMVKSQQAKIDELQKRIDTIVECVKNNTADYELDRKIQELLK